MYVREHRHGHVHVYGHVHVHVCCVWHFRVQILTVGHDNTPRCMCMLCMTLFRSLIAYSGSWQPKCVPIWVPKMSARISLLTFCDTLRLCNLSLTFWQRWFVHLKCTAFGKHIWKAFINSDLPSVPNAFRLTAVDSSKSLLRQNSEMVWMSWSDK